MRLLLLAVLICTVAVLVSAQQKIGKNAPKKLAHAKQLSGPPPRRQLQKGAPRWPMQPAQRKQHRPQQPPPQRPQPPPPPPAWQKATAQHPGLTSPFMRPSYRYNPGSCPRNARPVPCIPDPCLISKCPKVPMATCASNTCGTCTTEWYLGGMRVMDCD